MTIITNTTNRKALVKAIADDDIKKIKSWILEPGKLELHRVAVTGMGGLGKTTVVQKIYNDADIPRCFDTKIWVRVSKNFSKYKILKSILAKLIGRRLSELQPTAYLGELRKAVERKRGCLVVMDDVWSIDDVNWWESLCSTFDVPNQRNCIIVTTRNREVAKLVTPSDTLRIHEPRTLNESESWLLFSRFAFPRSEFEGKGRTARSSLPLKLQPWTFFLSFHFGCKSRNVFRSCCIILPINAGCHGQVPKPFCASPRKRRNPPLPQPPSRSSAKVAKKSPPSF